MARIVVTGYMFRHPFGGNIATFFQYVLGLSRLGHQVLYLEDKGWEWSCYEPETGQLEQFPRTGLQKVRALGRRYCPDVPMVYVDADAGIVDGMVWADVKTALASADLLIDVSGMCWLPERLAAARKALIDTDPLFTQVGQFGGGLLGDYDIHFSYGTTIGAADCLVPTQGIDWLPTVPPCVCDLWEADPPTPDLPLTTVATWNSYGEVEHNGVRYGQKESEFRRIFGLPALVTPELEVALSNADEETRQQFLDQGWNVLDGLSVSEDIESYRAYVHRSMAELSPAKHAYVATGSGWFSERTVCYLAAGRPAVIQNTGFTSWLRSGRGVLAFTTLDEAAEAVERVFRELAAQSQAARELAASTFDYRVVLPRILDTALAARPVP